MGFELFKRDGRGFGVDPAGRGKGFFNVAVGQSDNLPHRFWISKRATLAVGILATGLCCGGGLVLINLLVK